MVLPDWSDTTTKRGTKIRIALWLLSEVGEGNLFTKAQLRDAFPGVEQVDRRMRDLRDNRWVIATNKDDVTLDPNELRFVKAGDEVWKPGRSAPSGDALTAKQRAVIMAADDYMCVVCGITGGEPYPDAPHLVAQLSVTRRDSESLNGVREVQYVTECKRCRAGAAPGVVASLPSVLESLGALDVDEREALALWIAKGRRQPTRVDQLWSEYRRLPSDARKMIHDHLRLIP
ncbi:hypothetical protein SAMN05216275_11580 [Streptosporangium canum]|uniref:HNH endonuclease n=1 Tax=Streptosporangium canum TaxID=324952 RepID=A0A1I3VY22_9ACTN|nr:hypothetical protein [Streptosporangium canum]SFK00274.1 hypothetical protein SAMN05216275_11580 [Streptosporangium canum]